MTIVKMLNIIFMGNGWAKSSFSWSYRISAGNSSILIVVEFEDPDNSSIDDTRDDTYSRG